MALTMGGSKRWPKWKTLQQFAKLQCGLNTKKLNQAVAALCRESHGRVQPAPTCTIAEQVFVLGAEPYITSHPLGHFVLFLYLH